MIPIPVFFAIGVITGIISAEKYPEQTKKAVETMEKLKVPEIISSQLLPKAMPRTIKIRSK